MRLGLARSYQITSIFRRFSVADNLALAVQARSGSSVRFWRPWREEISALRRSKRNFLERVGLAGRAHTPAAERSRTANSASSKSGSRWRPDARLLLLDEPMAGMGPDESQRMIELIAGLKAVVTVLLVEHDMDAVFRLADRISVLVSGRIIATGAPDAIRANAEVKRAYLGDEVAA